MLLELVAAEVFSGDAEGGATFPARTICRRGDSLVDVYAKFSSPKCSPGSLCRELIGCLLAKRVGLKVGEPVLVGIDDLFIESVRPISPSSSARMRNSVRPAFGSIALDDGYVRCNGIDPSEDALAQIATEIWAFDQLILNPDRNATKPNCLVKGESLAVIDHEKALVAYGIGSLFPPPWGQRWTSDVGHLFNSIVRNTVHPLGRLKAAWEEVTDAEIYEMFESVPTTWREAEPDAFDSAIHYLRGLQANIGSAFRNLERARI